MCRTVFFIIFTAALVLMLTMPVFPAELNLGQNNFAVKLDSIHFKDKALNDLDHGFYVGLEGYGDLGQNFYIGAEVGYVSIDGSVENLGFREDRELIYIPIEVNLKYTIKIIKGLVCDLGAGVSYNYAKEGPTGNGFSPAVDEWLWGGQLFGDLNYRIGKFFVGGNVKYQTTKEGNDFKHDYDNLRAGGQIGVMF